MVAQNTWQTFIIFYIQICAKRVKHVNCLPCLGSILDSSDGLMGERSVKIENFGSRHHIKRF